MDKSMLDRIIEELLETDKTGSYQAAINQLVPTTPELQMWRTDASIEPEKPILDTLRIITGSLKVTTADKTKQAGVITKIMLKSLQIAQTALLGLLFKSPVRVGLAYNTLHSVIKFLKRDILKADLKMKDVYKAVKTIRKPELIKEKQEVTITKMDKNYVWVDFGGKELKFKKDDFVDKFENKK